MLNCKTKTTVLSNYEQRGVTVIETMVVIALLAILTSMALPALQEMMINHRLEGKAREYVANMNWARALAVSSNQAVNLRIAADESASCYVVFHGPVDDCSCHSNGATCTTPGNELLAVVLPHSDGVGVSTRTPSARTRISPTQGTISPTLTAIFTGSNGKAIHNISNILGRTRSCTAEEAHFGFRIC
ncbi:MAG: GspH/FimT family pseudopilin [Rhodoferax sp.]|nr:GspH/FimT family pseudopilin [Rhodoferax sp.]